jgi:hypothetical protein
MMLLATALAIAASPEPPRVLLDTTEPVQAGRTLAVPAGADLQAAINTAQPGDTLVLQSGTTFVGNYTLPVKPANGGWIVVRTSGTVPTPGSRVSPMSASGMARIVAGPNGDAVSALPGAHHYRFIGIEFASSPSTFTYNLVTLGWAETSTTQVPHHIIIDRCYVHGDPTKGGRRGVSINGTDMAVIDSYVSDFKEVGADTQAVFGFNGPGPFKIVNNYLEAAGENVMFGGAAPSIPGNVPSDIEIRHNLFSKPLAWKGSAWTVKNLLEFKIAQRVLVDGNTFEHNWPAAQSGWSVLFTPRAEGGAAPQAVVQDVTVSNNLLRDLAHGFNALGIDDSAVSKRTSRIAIRNNLMVNVNGDPQYGPGSLFQVLSGVVDLTIEHNTGFGSGSIIGFDGEPPDTGFVFRNNIALHSDYGAKGSGYNVGNASLDHYASSAVFTKNAIVGPFPVTPIEPLYDHYPGNYFPLSKSDVGFTDAANGNYKLTSTSPYKSAGTDGKDLGVDFAAYDAAQAGGGTGLQPTPTPIAVATASPALGTTATPAPMATATPSDLAKCCQQFQSHCFQGCGGCTGTCALGTCAAGPNGSSSCAAAPTPTAAATSTVRPTATVAPTAKPTLAPTAIPTVVPTRVPTLAPTVQSTPKPIATATVRPTPTPTTRPASTPTTAPTSTPTRAPTLAPTRVPTPQPRCIQILPWWRWCY